MTMDSKFDAYHQPHVLRARYDFGEHLGVNPSTVTLDTEIVGDDAQLPDNVIVFGVWYEVRTAVTSGGAATLALQLAGGTNIMTLNLAQMGTIGMHSPWAGASLVVDNTSVANPVRNASGAAVDIEAVIGGAAITDGVVDFYLQWCYANTR
jgi:hypothetical protein